MGDTEREAVAAQLQEMRERLLLDADAAGMPEPTVLTAIEDVAAGYAQARVTSFVAVLVEREVRARLGLPRRS